MPKRQPTSRILLALGGVAMAVGGLDPLEGALLILPGSALVAVGSYLGGGDRRVLLYRLWGFVLTVVGVGALWYVSSLGGLGGTTGRSGWWGAACFLPYLTGWSVLIWGPGAPRWLCALGLAVGAWWVYMSLVLTLQPERGWATIAVLGALGLVTLAGCLYRLRRPPPSAA